MTEAGKMLRQWYRDNPPDTELDEKLPPEIARLMEYGVVCDHDDGWLCPSRLKAIRDLDFAKAAKDVDC